MHFNKQIKDNSLSNLRFKQLENSSLVSIDVVKVDDHSRLTFTKRIKDLLPIQSGDIVAFYQDPDGNGIIFKVQRQSVIVDSWYIKRILI